MLPSILEPSSAPVLAFEVEEVVMIPVSKGVQQEQIDLERIEVFRHLFIQDLLNLVSKCLYTAHTTASLQLDEI
jgi:hypothetical protein